jgi:hypothetical protein
VATKTLVGAVAAAATHAIDWDNTRGVVGGQQPEDVELQGHLALLRVLGVEMCGYGDRKSPH